MTAFSAEDRDAICETFERLLTAKGHETALRDIMATDAGFEKALWQDMAELGLLGLMVSEKHGGIGGSIEEAEALMEVSGSFLYSGPYMGSCVIAPVLLERAANETFSAPHLKNIVSGDTIFAVAGCGPSGDWTASPHVSATQSGNAWQLTGEAHFVCHARNADQILVAATVEDEVENEGKPEIAIFCVSSQAAGLIISPQKTDDQTLRVSTLNFEGVEAVRLEGVGQRDFEQAMMLGLAALAGEQAGATRKIFEITIEYLNTRFQFGQPIGRFQALKHMAADLLIEVESASTVARHAARALAAQSPMGHVLTYLAAFTSADNFRTVAAEAIQLHGGIAYTMEHSAHLYWRRAQTGQWLFGSSDRFRDLYLTQMERAL